MGGGGAVGSGRFGLTALNAKEAEGNQKDAKKILSTAFLRVLLAPFGLFAFEEGDPSTRVVAGP